MIQVTCQLVVNLRCLDDILTLICQSKWARPFTLIFSYSQQCMLPYTCFVFEMKMDSSTIASLATVNRPFTFPKKKSETPLKSESHCESVILGNYV